MKIDKIININTEFDFEASEIEISMRSGFSKKEIGSINLMNLLAPMSNSTYLVRVSGESMIDAGIDNGDLLVVERVSEPRNGQIVIASLNGEMAVKTLNIDGENISLISANKYFQPIKIEPYIEFIIQGVVKHVIKSL